MRFKLAKYQNWLHTTGNSVDAGLHSQKSKPDVFAGQFLPSILCTVHSYDATNLSKHSSTCLLVHVLY
jgi:hypothetical protein